MTVSLARLLGKSAADSMEPMHMAPEVSGAARACFGGIRNVSRECSRWRKVDGFASGTWASPAWTKKTKFICSILENMPNALAWTAIILVQSYGKKGQNLKLAEIVHFLAENLVEFYFCQEILKDGDLLVDIYYKLKW